MSTEVRVIVGKIGATEENFQRKWNNLFALPCVLDPTVTDVDKEASQTDDVDDSFEKCEARKHGTTLGNHP